jgi:hypothetical protein
LETDPDYYPTELSLILVRMPSLLERVARVQAEHLVVYIYDTTILNTGGAPEFLGAAEFFKDSSAETGLSLKLLLDTDYDDFRQQYTYSKFYEENVASTPSGTWRVSVVTVDDTYYE